MKTDPTPPRALALGQAVLSRSAWLLPVAVVAGAAVLGSLRGIGAAILVLAGGTLLGVIALLWKALQVLIGETQLSLESALDLGAASAADEQKQAILRALKDLEYEKSLGKLSDDDYRELAARYRAEAKAVLRSIDDNLGPARQQAERLIEAKLGPRPEGKPKKKKKREGASAPAEASPKPEAAPAEPPEGAPDALAADAKTPPEGTPAAKASPPDAPKADDDASPADDERAPDAPPKAESAPEGDASPKNETGGEKASNLCPSCSLANDADAAFCKACGTRLTPAAAAPSQP